MQINIFEGSRRVAILGWGAAALFTVGYLYFNRPVVNAHFLIFGPNVPPMRSVESPETSPDDGIEYAWDVDIGSGAKATLIVHFIAREYSNGEMLIPYKSEGGKVWGARRHHPEAESYIDTRTNAIASNLPEDTKTMLRMEASTKRKEEAKEAAQGFLLFSVIYWTTVYIIGWIVRGFAGIPMGKDSRPPGPSGKL